MSFWPWRRRPGEPETSRAPEGATPAGASLSVVEVWTAEQRAVVGIDLSQTRLTDLVNREASIPVVLLDAPPEDRSRSIDKRPEQPWIDLEAQEALIVFPPPQPTDPRRRLHRPTQPVEIAIGPFEISGAVHIPPGAQAAGFLFRLSVPFAAVTRAVVRDTRLPGFAQRAEVILVNLRRTTSIRDLGVAEAEGPLDDGSGDISGDSPMGDG